jgi:hypothetical protein
MEHVGSEYIVILNDPALRQGLIHDADRSHQSGRAPTAATGSGGGSHKRSTGSQLASIPLLARWSSSLHQQTRPSDFDPENPERPVDKRCVPVGVGF